MKKQISPKFKRELEAELWRLKEARMQYGADVARYGSMVNQGAAELENLWSLVDRQAKTGGPAVKRLERELGAVVDNLASIGSQLLKVLQAAREADKETRGGAR
jgi:hypothetical protein